MPKYSIRVERVVLEMCDVEIEAESPAEAAALAINKAEDDGYFFEPQESDCTVFGIYDEKDRELATTCSEEFDDFDGYDRLGAGYKDDACAGLETVDRKLLNEICAKSAAEYEMEDLAKVAKKVAGQPKQQKPKSSRSL